MLSQKSILLIRVIGAFLVASACVGSGSALAQSALSASLSGRVDDPSGSTIVGVTVVLTDAATGAQQSVTTSASGTYMTTAGVVIAMLQVKSLNALLLGERYAQSLGVAIRPVRIVGLCAAAMLGGSVTAFCGPVVFIGLLAPHAARALFHTGNHGLLIPAAALMGAVLASLADLITHLPWSKHVLHLNAVTGLIGAPFVLWLLIARTRLRLFEQ